VTGRKTKYTPDTVKKVTDAIRLGATYDLAGSYAGISRETFHVWMRTKPEFSDAVKDAEGAGAVGWLARIEQAAQAGTWQAAAWKLERRYPQQYGRTIQEQHHRHELVRREAEAIAAEIGKPELVAAIERDILVSVEAQR
jgi:hypothetical protein